MQQASTCKRILLKAICILEWVVVWEVPESGTFSFLSKVPAGCQIRYEVVVHCILEAKRSDELYVELQVKSSKYLSKADGSKDALRVEWNNF